MLRINKIKKYQRARYPKVYYYRRRPAVHDNVAKYGLGAAMIIAALENVGCDPVGTTGPPPVLPDMVTENEARAVVDPLFAAEGATLQNDVNVKIEMTPGDSVELEIDGYNASLKVGYEYIARSDSVNEYLIFTEDVRARLDTLFGQDGPYIKMIGPINKLTGYDVMLETITQSFIDSLKARGVI